MEEINQMLGLDKDNGIETQNILRIFRDRGGIKAANDEKKYFIL